VDGLRYQVERAVTLQVAASLEGGAPDPAPDGALEDLERCGALLLDPEPGRDRLDIRRATALQLERLGLAPERIALCPLCTAAEPLLFHSWRRDQVKAVQWSGVVSQGAASRRG
jgi:copper oxidase (laccase) domain-containing protein